MHVKAVDVVALDVHAPIRAVHARRRREDGPLERRRLDENAGSGRHGHQRQHGATRAGDRETVQRLLDAGAE